jgi:hypothetical protein
VSVLSVEATPVSASARSSSPAPPLQLHLGLGWAIAGLLNILFDLLPSEEPHGFGGDVLLSHAVDLGRHVGFGLLSICCAWLCQLWLPAGSALGWCALAVLSLVIGALSLPTDLDGLAERLSESLHLSPGLASLLIVVGISGAVPAVAWLTRQRNWRSRWLGVAVRAASGLGALAAFACNVSVSPGNNPSAHLYLSWLTALLAAAALPRLELPLVGAGRRRSAVLSLAVLLSAGSLWAFFGRHTNSVMISLARRPSSLHLLAIFHADAGLDNVHATVLARAGAFFAPRSTARPVPPSRTRPAVERPVVVMISIDSLRADVLGSAEGKQAMPELSALAESGAYFTLARSPGSMTKFTLGAVSSGRYFSQQYWSGSSAKWPTEDQSEHFASVLSKAGVYTAAFPAAGWLENSRGILRGFARNQSEGATLPKNPRWVDGRSLTADLLAALENSEGRSGLYWVHYLDSHSPYYRSGRGGTSFQRYLRALHNVDEYLAQVRQALSKPGLAERALLIVFADHGEAFGSHGVSTHGGNLYDELIRVPLVVFGAGVVPRSIDTPVSLMDLGPTILDWFGQDTPASFMGESLVPLLVGGQRTFARPIVAETSLIQAMLFADGYKAIRDLRRQTLELYDLKNDPGELNNLSDQIDPDHEEHVLLLRSFFQVHTYREHGYRVPYVK